MKKGLKMKPQKRRNLFFGGQLRQTYLLPTNIFSGISKSLTHTPFNPQQVRRSLSINNLPIRLFFPPIYAKKQMTLLKKGYNLKW